MKLAINRFVGTTGQVAAEAITLAWAGGVPWQQALDVLSASAAAFPLVGYKLPPLRARELSPAWDPSASWCPPRRCAPCTNLRAR